MSTSLFVGHARPPASTATGQIYKVLSLVLEVDDNTGIIVDADVSTASPLSQKYLAHLLVGRNLMSELGVIARDIERSYHSASQKAVIQALNDAGQKYMSAFLKRASSLFGETDYI